MDIFQRSIHSNVKQIDGGRLFVQSSLLDLEHSLHLELIVRTALDWERRLQREPMR